MWKQFAFAKFWRMIKMQGYNVIWVLNKNADKVLMCKRRKEPYKGLYNLVGGKIETDITNGIHNRDRSRSKRLTPSGVRLPSALTSSCIVCYQMGLKRPTVNWKKKLA